MKKITRNPQQPSYEVILQYLANKKLPKTDGVKLSLLALQTHTSPTPSKKHKSPVSDDLEPSSKKYIKLQNGGTKYFFKLLSTSKDDFDDFDDIPLFGGSKIIFVKSIKKSIRVKTRRRKQQKQKSRKLRKQKSKKHKSRKQKS